MSGDALKSVALLGGALAVAVGFSTAAAAQDRSVRIVSALYGRPQEARPFDFTARLQDICGPSADYCEAFCSRASVGGRPRYHGPFARRPICRVVYRCGGVETKATDAEENDTLILSCRTGH
jgi:hypothetical protein